jgi:hypothetical protein
MSSRALGLSLIVLAGCSSSSSGGSTGHSLTMNARLQAEGGELGFVTPAASVVKVPVADVVGKPYLIASFPAGFSPGNDPAIHWSWGRVPADLSLHYTTPSTYADGAYDMVVVVYTTTPITDAIMARPAHTAPAAVHGDLATFTFDNGQVRPGDPKIPAGVVRLVVDGKDASIDVANRPPADPSDQEQLKAAFTNVIMIVP